MRTSTLPARLPVSSSATSLAERLRGWSPQVLAWLGRRSRALVAFMALRMESLIVGWIAITVLLGVVLVALSPLPVHGPLEAVVMLLPYLLVAVSPIAGYRVAAGSFPQGLLTAQPLIRLCQYGSWRQLDPLAARQNPAFGPTGLMASLLAGLLLNVPFGTLEFMLAVPAVTPAAPDWAKSLQTAMSLNIVTMNFFYMVCFVMALRAVPLFPRMLVFTWTVDVLMQLAVAHHLAGIASLPAEVGQGLHAMLYGNIQKVLISVFVWLPYLILSDRVNITFRQRVRA